MKNKKILIAIMVVLVSCVLMGCTSKNAIVGEWSCTKLVSPDGEVYTSNDASYKMIFSEEGECTMIQSANTTLKAKYEIINQKELKLLADGDSEEQVWTYEIDGNKLSLVKQDGVTFYLEKVKKN